MIDDTETQSRSILEMTDSERAELFEYLDEAYETTSNLAPSTLKTYMKGKIASWVSDINDELEINQPDTFHDVTNAEANDVFEQWVSLVKPGMKKVI